MFGDLPLKFRRIGSLNALSGHEERPRIDIQEPGHGAIPFP